MTNRIIFILLLCFSFFSEGQAQSVAGFFDEADAFFSTYVSNGSVDYETLNRDPKPLESLLKKAAAITVPQTDKSTYQSFWINAYNLAVIKGVVDNYPINSPLDIDGFFDTVKYPLGERLVTLNEIENELLRAKFDDARFHFVLVCGAKGCPPLISSAYTPKNLEQKLQAQTTKALNDPEFVKVSDGAVTLSEIFKWYKVDFVKDGQTEIDFLNRFRRKKILKNSSVSYYTYNWNLNKK
jgi:hypothetical protein